MILQVSGENPVVSISKTTNLPSRRLALGIGYHTFQIIYKVRLHTIKHLEFRVLRHAAAPGIKAVVCLRECLYHTVVCDGNGRMSPLIGTLYQSFRLCDAVHVAHLGVAVKLHSLLRTGVHSGASEICNLLDSGNGTNGKLAVETVDGGDALDFQEGAFFTCSVTSGTCSLRRNIFTVMESVKSVTGKIRIVFSFRISLASTSITWQRTMTSPISWTILSRGMGSPSKSLPYITSGLGSLR